MREALPWPMSLAIAAWSVAAYGEGRWVKEPPASPYTGHA